MLLIQRSGRTGKKERRKEDLEKILISSSLFLIFCFWFHICSVYIYDYINYRFYIFSGILQLYRKQPNVGGRQVSFFLFFDLTTLTYSMHATKNFTRIIPPRKEWKSRCLFLFQEDVCDWFHCNEKDLTWCSTAPALFHVQAQVTMHSNHNNISAS